MTRYNDTQSDNQVKVGLRQLKPKARLTQEEARALIALNIPFAVLMELTRDQLMKQYPQAFTPSEQKPQG